MLVLELSKEDAELVKLIKQVEPELPSEDPKLIALFRHIKSDLPALDDGILIMWWLKRAWNDGRPDWPNCIRPWLYNREDIKFLQNLGWHKKDVQLHLEDFEISHRTRIINYMQHLEEPPPQPLELSQSDIDRSKKCRDFLIKNDGIFPYPLVLQSVEQGYRVFDGEHRLAAYFHLRNKGIKVRDKQLGCIGSA